APAQVGAGVVERGVEAERVAGDVEVVRPPFNDLEPGVEGGVVERGGEVGDAAADPGDEPAVRDRGAVDEAARRVGPAGRLVEGERLPRAHDAAVHQLDGPADVGGRAGAAGVPERVGGDLLLDAEP